MTEEEFRERAKQDFARLLEHWRTVERWIKKAEQINNSALIPAINELRYAGRQLFNALLLFDDQALTPLQIRWIEKRIIIAEQYLFNAEHDISDGIVGFYRSIVQGAEDRFGRNIITSHFPDFPRLREIIHSCDMLIEDARGSYENRTSNYRTIRENHLPTIISLHERFIDAQVSAEEETERTENELRRSEGRANVLWWFTIISFPIAVVSFPLTVIGLLLTIYVWVVTPEKYCERHSGTSLLNVICPKTEPLKPHTG
jgi:hypothetical protein